MKSYNLTSEELYALVALETEVNEQFLDTVSVEGGVQGFR